MMKSLNYLRAIVRKQRYCSPLKTDIPEIKVYPSTGLYLISVLYSSILGGAATMHSMEYTSFLGTFYKMCITEFEKMEARDHATAKKETITKPIRKGEGFVGGRATHSSKTSPLNT